MDRPASNLPGPARPTPVEFLAEARADVERVLSEIPDNRLEARRIVTREWGFDPTPEQLQIIVRLAHDDVAQAGMARELARAALAVKIRVEQILRDLMDSRELDADRVRRIAESLPDHLATIDALSRQFGSIGGALPPQEREFLRRAEQTLMPSRDALLAGDLLAPRLEQVARAESEEDVRSAVPRLPAPEVELLVSTVCPHPSDAAGDVGQVSDRTCVNAAVLSAVMLDDVAAWNELATSVADGRAQESQSAVTPEQQVLVERLRRDRIAHRRILERLQGQVNAATLAGLEDYAAHLRRAQKGLSKVYRKLVAALEAACPDGDCAEEGRTQAVDLQQLLEESAAEDARADADRLHHSKALWSKPGKAAAETQAYDRKREQLRIRVLGAIAALLFAACLGVWGWRLRSREDPLAAPLSEMSDALILDEAMSVGPMLYAVVSHWSWDNMSDEERLSSVRALGLSAANRGYDSVYLVDERRSEVAVWTKRNGAQLESTEGNETPSGP